MNTGLGPFPSWFAVSLFGAGMVWVVYEVDATAGKVFAGILILSVLVARPNAIASLSNIFNMLNGGSSSNMNAKPVIQSVGI